MTIQCDVVYEKGVFRPLCTDSLPFYEGQNMTLSLEEAKGEDILALARQVYAGLSEKEIDEIEAIALDRSHFYSEK